MKKIQLVAVAVLLGTLLVSCGEKTTPRNTIQDEIIPVKIMSLSPASGGGAIQASGQFTTDDESFLSFKTSGIINHIYVQEGQAIKAGQLLATINVTEINAQTAQVQLSVEKAQRDYERIQNLYRDSVATLEQLQNAHTAWDQARQQLNAAQFNKTYSEIHASRNGFVLRKLMSEGQVVSTGTPVLQTNGAASGKWLLRVGVSDQQWAQIHLQDAAKVTASSLPGQVFEGTVYRRSEGADATTGSFSIDIQVSNTAGAPLASGLFGKATISTGNSSSGTHIWHIPYDALMDGDGNTGNVFITNDNKTAHKVPVLLSGMEKNEVLVSGDLDKAAALIISGSAYLTDSSLIRVIQ